MFKASWTKLEDVYDVQVETEEIEEGEPPVIEIDVNPVYIMEDGLRTTDLGETLASVVVEANGFNHAGFIETTETAVIEALPEHVREAYMLAVDIAKNGENRRFKSEDRVWIKDHQMIGLISGYSTGDRYHVHMGMAFVYDFFTDDDLEPYDETFD